MFADAFAGAPLQDISGRLPDIVGDDPVGAFGSAATRFGEATQVPGALDRVLPLPFGPMTVRTFLRFVAFDLTVHTWDVASVTGAEVEFPEDLLLEIEAFAHVVLDAVPRGVHGASLVRPSGRHSAGHPRRECPRRGQRARRPG